MNHYRSVAFGIFIVSILLSLTFVSFCEGVEQWSQVIGGSEPEFAYSIINTTDGGYAAVGFIYHIDGWCSLWLMKLDASGNKQWTQTLDNYAIDSQFKIIQTQDGGYAIAGSNSYYSAGYNDVMLIKTDSSGKAQWNKTYGGEGDEKAYSLVQTSDDGYALAGSKWGSGGLPAFWLLKVDSSGNELWNQIYEDSNLETSANCIVVTKDGGFAIAGYTIRSDDREDFRLVKVDSSGKLLWSQTYGGSDRDIAYSVVQTGDGGYALAGNTGIANFRGNFLLVKTDSSGNEVWSKQYGGDFEEFGAYSLVQLSDGGYALAGGLGLAEPMNAIRDFLLVKTDSSGGQLWNRTYGGSGDDYANCIVKTNDGAYVVIGYTTVDTLPKVLIVKTEVLETIIAPSPSIAPSNSQASSSSPDASTYPSPTVPEFSTMVILAVLVFLAAILLMVKWKH